MYRTYRLEPAKIAPPSLASRSASLATTKLHGDISLVLAEDADWNRWPDSTSRLFNNRSAHLFHVDVRPKSVGDQIRWIPERTKLELNVRGNTYNAAPNQELLLEELVFWSFQEAQSGLEGDLVDRTRGAGDLRNAYASRNLQLELTGIIAFPLLPTEQNQAYLQGRDPSEIHVVSMRLTLGLELNGKSETLIWLLE